MIHLVIINKTMYKNLGITDRIIRVLIGMVIIVLGIVFNSWLGLLGILQILTAIFARCGAYYIFGINTCKVNKQ